MLVWVAIPRAELLDSLVDMNQHSPLLSREDTKLALSSSALCSVISMLQRLRLCQMVEIKIALMVMLIAILFFAIYFTALPG
jgi:hypothetical protein